MFNISLDSHDLTRYPDLALIMEHIYKQLKYGIIKHI